MLKLEVCGVLLCLVLGLGKEATGIALLSERERLVIITGESGNAVPLGYLWQMARIKSLRPSGVIKLYFGKAIDHCFFIQC